MNAPVPAGFSRHTGGLSVLILALLSACSGGDDSPAGAVDLLVAGGEPDGQLSGVWVGDMGAGEGHYIIDNLGEIFGLVNSPDSTAVIAVHGEFETDEQGRYVFVESQLPDSHPVSGNSFMPWDASRQSAFYRIMLDPGATMTVTDAHPASQYEPPGPPEYTVRYDNTALSAPDISELAGSRWRATHGICLDDSDPCLDWLEIRTRLEFGEGSFTGEAGIFAGNDTLDNQLPFIISNGRLAALGSVLRVGFTLDDTLQAGPGFYEGVLYRDPAGSGQLLLNATDAQRRGLSFSARLQPE